MDRNRIMTALAEAHARGGDTKKARAVLEQMLEMARNGQPMFIPIAIAATALGEKELALEWLSKGIENRDILVAYLTVMPSLKSLHDEPRYKELVESMKLRHPSTQRRRRAAG